MSSIACETLISKRHPDCAGGPRSVCAVLVGAAKLRFLSKREMVTGFASHLKGWSIPCPAEPVLGYVHHPRSGRAG